MQVQSLHQEDPLEEEMAIHSSILAYKIPWAEEPGRLLSTYTSAGDSHTLTGKSGSVSCWVTAPFP